MFLEVVYTLCFGFVCFFFFLSQQRVSLGIKEALKESSKTTDEEQLKKSLKGKYPRQDYKHLVVRVICLGKETRCTRL